jgi:hypothetical protein
MVKGTKMPEENPEVPPVDLPEPPEALVRSGSRGMGLTQLPP